MTLKVKEDGRILAQHDFLWVENTRYLINYAGTVDITAMDFGYLKDVR